MVQPPRTLGRILSSRYRLLEVVGTGGMGSVYKAMHLGLNRLVALKLLHRHVADYPGAIERFRREAMLLARLHHPGAVLVHDFGEEEGDLFIAMELLEGTTFEELVSSTTPIPPPRVVALCAQVLEVLEAAHGLGIIHRDLKPSNLFLLQDGERERVKVLDFGLATVVGEGELAKLTQSGVVQGTPEYMSPEQCKGETLGQTADLYSLGCILYELLTGQLPFTAGSAAEVFVGHMYRAPVPPSKLAPERAIPAPLDALVLRALAKLPSERPPDAKTMRQELLASLEARTPPPRREGKQTEREATAAGPRAVPLLLGAAEVAVIEPAGVGSNSVATALGVANIPMRLVAADEALHGFSVVVFVPGPDPLALAVTAALLQRAGQVPVLLCGPEDDLALMASAIEAGVYDYVPLPLDPVDLSRKVARAQRQRR